MEIHINLTIISQSLHIHQIIPSYTVVLFTIIPRGKEKYHMKKRFYVFTLISIALFMLFIAGCSDDDDGILYYSLTLELEGTGSGSVFANGIDCGNDCTHNYEPNTEVTLTASADNGSVFAGWSGANCGTSEICTVTMDQSKTLSAAFNTAAKSIRLNRLGTYSTQIYDDGAAEIPAYDPETRRVFVVNGAQSTIDIIDISSPALPALIQQIDVTEYGSGANSCAFKNGVLAIAVENENTQDNGKVVFFNADGNYLNDVPAGALPDMLTFTPDGLAVLVANEGEPDDEYSVDPEGSITIIDISRGIAGASATQAYFTDFNSQIDTLRDQGVRIFGPNAAVAQDVEPEYIAVSSDSQTAYVSLQENNAFAVVDIPQRKITHILPLGFKNHNIQWNGIDPSDADGKLEIRNAPVFGMYQPDGIAVFDVDGETYIISANEGDSRDYDTFSEEARVEDIVLDEAAFPEAASIQTDETLGRLKITLTHGDTDGDGDFDELYAFGARSFSIWKVSDSDLSLVYDSGDTFEDIVFQLYTDADARDIIDSRSDDKGPEPEGVAVGKIDGRIYAFICLERTGGIMVYDVTDPTAPTFIEFVNPRNFAGELEAGTAGDVAPEGLVFVPAADGRPSMLIAANEDSGTTTIYEIEGIQTFALTVMHLNDSHSHLESGEESFDIDGVETEMEVGGFPRLAAYVSTIRNQKENTMLLHAGDAVQGTLYFTAYNGAAEFDFLNLLEVDAMVTGNHEFDRGPEALSTFIGYAHFPILAANIDDSNDPALSGLIGDTSVFEFNGEHVGVIGMALPDTPNISSPGEYLIFEDDIITAQREVQKLEGLGVNKIIVLSHLGYESDIELARAVEGIDIIVGGHDHALLGTLNDIGKSTSGKYPTLVYKPSGQHVCVVQAWSEAKVLGVLDVEFDADGYISKFNGTPVFTVGDEFRQEDNDGNSGVVGDIVKAEIMAMIDATPALEVVSEDVTALGILQPYKSGIEALTNEVIGTVTEDLLHERIPGSTDATGEVLEDGSYIAPIVCDSYIWKLNNNGLDVDLSIQNAGGVRIDVFAGDFTVGTAYTLLPFGNTLVVLELTGAEIVQSLEESIERAISGTSGGAYPYVGNARYTVDVTQPYGSRVLMLEIKTGEGQWAYVEDTTVYRVATNNYIAAGGDGYVTFGKAYDNGYAYDTGFVDAEAFVEYVKYLGALERPKDTGITFISSGNTAYAGPTFAVFSDPHYFDPDLGTSGAAFEEYLIHDRKLIKEGPAILEAALNAIKANPDIDFVIVPGDLTKDGEWSSHNKFANYMKTLEDQRISVYVIPGNHDIDNPHAMSYVGDAAVPTSTVTPKQFSEIYFGYGYAEALYTDPRSLSYVAEPARGIWLFALDACRYDENEEAGKPVTGGMFTQATLDWIVDKLDRAKVKKKKVVGMLHHGLIEHFAGQSQMEPGSEYVIDDWETVSKTLAEAGLQTVFTGHYHAQDITRRTWETQSGTVSLTDVETGSLVTAPCPYRIVDMANGSVSEISSSFIENIDYDTGGMTFTEYAASYLESGLNILVAGMLMAPVEQGGFGLSEEDANYYAPLISAAYMAHYAGDESPSVETMMLIESLMQSGDAVMGQAGQLLYTLWMDLPPADNYWVAPE